MTASFTKTPAILNDFKRIEAGEVDGLRDLSNDFLEMLVADEDMEFFTRNRAKTELTIRKHGISLIAVMADDSLTEEEMLANQNRESIDSFRKPAFVYTVGMDRVGLPEMLTFYPNPRDCHFILNELHEHLLDNFNEVPASDDQVAQFDPLENENLPVFATLLSKEEREWAYEDFTCQVESTETPVMLIHIPAPNGESSFEFIPEELQGFAARLRDK
ncbi:DUF4262 domain-containing protein [bacterium]|nr:DUF4262 domain-containing protein [bacterium]